MVYFVMSCFILTWALIIFVAVIVGQAHKEHSDAIEDLENLMQQRFSELEDYK